jgi:hypothetical protein
MARTIAARRSERRGLGVHTPGYIIPHRGRMCRIRFPVWPNPPLPALTHRGAEPMALQSRQGRRYETLEGRSHGHASKEPPTRRALAHQGPRRARRWTCRAGCRRRASQRCPGGQALGRAVGTAWARDAIRPAQLADGLITPHTIDEMLDVDLHGWTPVRDRRMGWHQGPLSSYATTPESKKSAQGKAAGAPLGLQVTLSHI